MRYWLWRHPVLWPAGTGLKEFLRVTRTATHNRRCSYRQCDYCLYSTAKFSAYANKQPLGQACLMHVGALFRDALKADPYAILAPKN